VWALAQRRGDGYRSLVTPERVLSEYNEDLIFFAFLQLEIYLREGRISALAISKLKGNAAPILIYNINPDFTWNQSRSVGFASPVIFQRIVAL